MTQTATRELAETMAAYLAIWNVEDPDARAKLIEEAFVDDGRYVDPARDATGYSALNQMITEARPHFPGHSVKRTSGVDAHHEQIRFAWELVGPDGGVVITGIDVGVLAPDGRLRQITGFFGDLPAE